MKKEIFALAIAALFLISGCITPPPPPVNKLPEDFELRYESGAMHLDWGYSELEVDAEGKAVFVQHLGMEMQKSFDFQATEEELLKIYNSALKNGFFGLREQYYDPSIMDGGWSRITITANSSTHSVELQNFYLQQFDAVEAEINSLIAKKLGEEALSYDFRKDCQTKKQECEGTGTVECEEWINYCIGEESEDGAEITAEYCDAKQNRVECIEHCIEEQCGEDVCEALMFPAAECSECEPGCCNKCNSLKECESTIGCAISWVYPSGESWQFGGCDNLNFCMDDETACNYISVSAQGYRYTSTIEQDYLKSQTYSFNADLLQEAYEANCE